MAPGWLSDNVLVADRNGRALLEVDPAGRLIDDQGRVSSIDEGSAVRSIDKLAYQVNAWLKWAAPEEPTAWQVHPKLRDLLTDL